MNDTERATKVLVSQGFAPLRLPSLPAKLQGELAALCDEDGQLAVDVRQQVRELMQNYQANQKAVIE